MLSPDLMMKLGEVFGVIAFLWLVYHLVKYLRVKRINDSQRRLRSVLKVKSKLKPGEWEFPNEAFALREVAISAILLFLSLLLYLDGFFTQSTGIF